MRLHYEGSCQYAHRVIAAPHAAVWPVDLGRLVMVDPPVLQRLEITLLLPEDRDQEQVRAFVQLFQHLAPSLRHLVLRVRNPITVSTAQGGTWMLVRDAILSLTQLRTLSIGGTGLELGLLLDHLPPLLEDLTLLPYGPWHMTGTSPGLLALSPKPMLLTMLEPPLDRNSEISLRRIEIWVPQQCGAMPEVWRLCASRSITCVFRFYDFAAQQKAFDYAQE